MFCNIFSKLFGKKEKKVDKIDNKKANEETTVSTRKWILYYRMFCFVILPETKNFRLFNK